MKTGIILAGGHSSRMGEDKSLINSNVARLSKEMRKSGCTRIIVMCGTEERSSLFEEECIPDSSETLAESLLNLLSGLKGRVQLAPCDAYLADAEFFSAIEGVPTDDSGERQPLLANFDAEIELEHSIRISEVFRNLPSCKGGLQARNTNTPTQLKEIQSFLPRADQ
jgi:molybdopterin-guanine dinucleotide biosynthesis protein A